MVEGIKIENDVLDIAWRIREVDPSYTIVFCKGSGKFLLYGGKDGGYLLTFPFDKLDARCVEHARKTRVERAKQLLAELDLQNAELERLATKEQQNKMEERLYVAAERVLYEERKGNHCAHPRD